MLPPPVSSSSSSTSASLSTATTSSKRQRANFAAPSLSSSSSSSSSSLSSRVSSAVIPASRLLQMPRSILAECIGGFLEMNEVLQMRYACRQLYDLRFHLYGSCRVPGAKKDNIPAIVSTYVIHSLDLTLDMTLPGNLTNFLIPPLKCMEMYSKRFNQALPPFPLSALCELTVLSPPDVQPGFELSCIRVLNVNYFHLDAHREAHNFFVGCSSVTELCIDQITFPWNYKRQSYLAMFKRLTRLSFNSGYYPREEVMQGLLSTPLPPLTVVNIPGCKVLISWVCSLSSLKVLHIAGCIDDVSAVGPSSSELSQSSSSSSVSSQILSYSARSSNIFFESAALPPLKVLTIGYFGVLGTLDVYADKWLVAPHCTTLTALNIEKYNCNRSLPCDLSNYTNLTSLSFGFAFTRDPKAQSIELRKFLSTAPPSLRKLEIGTWLGASLSLPVPSLTELLVIWWSDQNCEQTDSFEQDYPNMTRASFVRFPLKTLFQFTTVLTHLSLLDPINFNDEFVNTLPTRVPGLRSLEIIQDRPLCRPEETEIVGPYRLPMQHPTLTTLYFKERWFSGRPQEATLIFTQRTVSGRSYLVKYPDNPFYVVADSRIQEGRHWPLSVYAAAKTSTGPLLWTRFIIDNDYLRIES